MNTTEQAQIDQSIAPTDQADAVRLVGEWTLDRLLGWDEDLRDYLVRILIAKVAFLGVEPPKLWYDIAMDPAYYTELGAHDDEPPDSAAADPSWRPTEAVENEFLDS